ncbi:MAG: ABC transporter permease [bacterium]
MLYVSFEKRLRTSFYTRTGYNLLSILIAVVIGGVFLALVDANPFSAYGSIVSEVLMTSYGWEDLLTKMSPLLLTGVAVALAANMRIWNIGAEGQLYFGAVITTWIALNYGSTTSSAVIIPVMMAAAMVAGALWAMIPAILKAQYNVNEIITTLLMNYIAISLVDYFVFGPWRDPKGLNFPITEEFAASANLPTFGESPVHIGILFGLALIVIIYFVLKKTNIGVQITITGDNPDAGFYSGINIKRLIIIILMVSGAIAGLAGMTEITGVQHRLRQNISLGYGFTGVIIAWLARNHPLGIVFYTFFMAIVFVGGELLQINYGLPKAMIDLFQGMILFCVLGLEIFGAYKLKFKWV